MPEGVQILTSEASLDTVSVSLKALRVGPRQMTMAVFRQLPELCPVVGTAVDSSLKFWGKVRYSIKDQGSLWGVAEHDGSLYRCDLEYTPIEPWDMRCEVASVSKLKRKFESWPKGGEEEEKELYAAEALLAEMRKDIQECKKSLALLKDSLKQLFIAI